MQATTPAVLYEVRDAVAHLTLNRPQVLNAIDRQMLDELEQAVDRLRDDTRVKAAVLRGAGGRAFSAGVDLKEMQQAGILQDAGQHLRFTARLRDVLRKVELAPVPVIAAVDGYALAGGLELALACDLLLCTDDAQIGDQHANRFLMAGGGGTQRLPRRIGAQRALELLFTGRRLNGPQAVEYGLALRTCPRDSLDEEVERLLALLRDKSRTAQAMTKRALQRGGELPLAEALDFERLVLQEYLSCHPDAHAGLAQFNAKDR